MGGWRWCAGGDGDDAAGGRGLSFSWLDVVTRISAPSP